MMLEILMKLPFLLVAKVVDAAAPEALQHLCYHRDFRYVRGALLTGAVCTKIRTPMFWERRLCLPEHLFGRRDAWYSEAHARLGWLFVDAADQHADKDPFRALEERKKAREAAVR